MQEARFVFVMGGEFEPTVIDSQVVDAIAALEPEGIRLDLLLLMHGGVMTGKLRENLARRAEVARRISGRVEIIPVPRQGLRTGLVLGAAALALDMALHPARRTIFHGRGELVSSFAAVVRRRLRSVRMVYDARGDSVAEQLMYAERQGIPPERAELAHQFERARRLSVDHADHVFCVSTVLRDRLRTLYGLPEDRFTVVPCVADPAKFRADEAERATLRRDLGIEDRFVVVYPGRLGRWHEGERVFELVRALAEKRADVYFLVLTPDVEEACALAATTLPAGRWSVTRAAHSEVPRYLRASDLGILIRERHPLNEVACPTKFAEYVMSGLPVLISEGIGDCTRFVRDHRAGVVLERNEPALAVAGVEALRVEDAVERRRRVAAAAQGFRRDRAAREMAAVYRHLASAEEPSRTSR